MNGRQSGVGWLRAVAAWGMVVLALTSVADASARVLCPAGGANAAGTAPLLGDNVDIGCPLHTAVPRVVNLSVKVRKYCVADFPFAHHQTEFKLKVQVKNLGSSTLDIRASHWKMLVSRMNPNRWYPPAHGGAVGKPERISWHGYQVWAVPANANRSYDSDPSGSATFASYWDATDLAPGATYYRPGNRQGDLAFYVPRRYVTQKRNLIGLAYVADGKARVVARYHSWRNRRPADDF